MSTAEIVGSILAFIMAFILVHFMFWFAVFYVEDMAKFLDKRRYL